MYMYACTCGPASSNAIDIYATRQRTLYDNEYEVNSSKFQFALIYFFDPNHRAKNYYLDI